MSALMTPPAPSEGLGAPPAAPPATLPALPALPAAKTLGVVHSSTVHVVVADSELELRLSLQRPSPRRMDYAYMCERNAFIDPNAGGCRARAASPPPRLFGTAPQSPPPPQQQQQQQQQQQPQHAAKLRPLTLAGSARDQKARLWSSAAPTPGALPTFRPPTWAASQSARQRAACARGAAPPPLSTAAAAQALVPRWRQLLDEWGSPPPVDTAAQLGSVVGAPRFADRDGRQSRQRARGLKGERELALLARRQEVAGAARQQESEAAALRVRTARSRRRLRAAEAEAAAAAAPVEEQSCGAAVAQGAAAGAKGSGAAALQGGGAASRAAPGGGGEHDDAAAALLLAPPAGTLPQGANVWLSPPRAKPERSVLKAVRRRGHTY